MKKLTKFIAQTTLAMLVALNLALPAVAQSDLFSSPLDEIRDHLSEEGIEIVDFEDELSSGFGNLEEDLVETLEAEGYTNLIEVREDLLLDANGNELSNTEQILALEAIGLTNEQANQIFNEIHFRGESQINSIAATVIKIMRNLIAGIAIIFIVISGVRLITAGGDETIINEQKKGLIYSVIGLMTILLVDQLIKAIYGLPGLETQISDPTSTQAFSAEILGLVAYIKSLVGIVAVGFIMINGARVIAAQGEEEKIKQQYKAITWVGVGLLIVLINETIIDNIFIFPNATTTVDPNAEAVITGGNIGTIITLFGNVVKFGLGFVGLIALGMLVYGGGLLIANYTNEELVEKAKKIIVNSAMGIVVILSAYALIATMINFS